MFNWKLFFKNLGLMAISLLIGGVVMATDDKSEEFVPLDVVPEVIKQVDPVYPTEAKQDGIECELWVKAFVDAEGNVTDTKLYKTSIEGYGFAEAAMAAAKECKYKPGIQNGKPIGAWITYKVIFSLADKADHSAVDESDYPPSDSFIKLDIMPEMISTIRPDYPVDAKEKGIEGTVMVRALVGKDGSVKKAEIADVSKTGYGFEEAAMNAAHKCQYKPGVQNGQPVMAWVTYKVEFTLGDCK